MDDSHEELTGGNSNRVVREGDTVIRKTGAWSPFVHQLLYFLTEKGFLESPVLLDTGDGYERLSFLAGQVGNYPLEAYMQTDAILIEAAKLLRRFHDLTQHFVPAPDSVFQLPANPYQKHEIICHNDFAPYNCVFRDGHLAGIIDFDSASPGTRLWDIAYAVYRFVPLTNDTHSIDSGWNPTPDRLSRLKLFCDAYGLEDRRELLPTVKQRLEAMIAYMQKNGSNLEHIPLYTADLQFLAEQQTYFAAALTP